MEFPPPDPPLPNFGQPSFGAPPPNFGQPSFGAPPPPPNFSMPVPPAQPSFGAPAAPNFNIPVPPYHQMITTAILALNERDGSSRQAISKYIENEFKNLPPTHSNELTQELRRMKNNGQLVLVKHSYMLPGSLPFAVANGLVPHAEVQAASDGPKRRPGRPPKLKPEFQSNGNPAVVSAPPPPPQSFGFVVDAPPLVREQSYGVPTTSLFGGLTSGVQFSGTAANAPTANAPTMNTVGAVSNFSPEFDQGAPAPVEQNNGPPAKRRPGRPPKVDRPAVSAEAVEPGIVSSDGADPLAQTNDRPPQEVESPVLGKRVRARPAKFMLMSVPLRAGMNRGRGRPPSFARTGRRGRPRKLPVSTIKPTGRPRGRPRKNGVGSVISVDGTGEGLVFPEAKKPRKLSGKPLGRPKKHASVPTVFASEQEESAAFENLKGRVEHLQSRIKQAVTVVKPYLNEAAVIAIGALQDLEELASMDIINAPENVESAQVNDLNGPVDVETVQVGDLNAPLDVQSAPVNFQSAPSTAQNAHVNVQSAPLAAQSASVTFLSGPVPVGPPSLQS